MDLRCGSRLHARLSEVDGRPALEFACRSALCGKSEGTVVLHYFDLETAEMVATRRYKQVIPREE